MIKRDLIKSLIGHVLLILLILVIIPNYFAFEKQSPLDIIEVEIPKGTGDDLEIPKAPPELPENTIQEQKNPMPEAKDATTSAPEKVEVQPKPAAADPKRLAEPEKAKPATNPTPAAPNSKMTAALANIDKQLRQRKITPEASQTGTGVGNQYGNSNKVNLQGGNPEYIRYRNMVKHKVMREWIRPPGVDALKPPQIRVHISASGQVTSKAFSRKSNDPSMDGSAMRAIDRASPFPVPPATIRDEILNDGFNIGF